MLNLHYRRRILFDLKQIQSASGYLAIRWSSGKTSALEWQRSGVRFPLEYMYAVNVFHRTLESTVLYKSSV